MKLTTNHNNYDLEPTYRLYNDHIIYCDGTGQPVKWAGYFPYYFTTQDGQLRVVIRDSCMFVRENDDVFVGDIYPYDGWRLTLIEPKTLEISTMTKDELHALIPHLPHWPCGESNTAAEMVVDLYEDGVLEGDLNIPFCPPEKFI
jgi:hypothetical protein